MKSANCFSLAIPKRKEQRIFKVDKRAQIWAWMRLCGPRNTLDWQKINLFPFTNSRKRETMQCERHGLTDIPSCLPATRPRSISNHQIIDLGLGSSRKPHTKAIEHKHCTRCIVYKNTVFWSEAQRSYLLAYFQAQTFLTCSYFYSIEDSLS